MNWNYTNAAKIAQKAAANNALRAAAKKAENNARAEAVRQSAAAAAAARKAAANKARKNRETVNEAFKKAAEKAAANAKKANLMNAAKNIKKNLNALSKRTNITKEKRLAQGRKIFRRASLTLHPNKSGNKEAFQILSGAYNNFEKNVNQN